MSGVDALAPLIGRWTLEVDLPDLAGVTGDVTFERLGELVIEHSAAPDPVPDSVSVLMATDGGGFSQHYYDSRGVARIYAMTFDGTTWTLLRSAPDFTPLEFHQRYVGTLSDDRSTVVGEWQTSDDGNDWAIDFALTYRRVT